MIRQILLCILLSAAVCSTGCRSTQSNRPETADSIAYATGFRFISGPDYTIVEVTNPWVEGALLERYVLVPDSVTLPEQLPVGTLIRTPLKRVVVCTSIHCNVLAAIDIRKQIAGVCGSQYIKLDFIHQGLLDGRIIDLGNSARPDAERLIELAPDALFVSSVNNPSAFEKFRHAGIPVIECADYMETHPLGRSEWLRFYGLLFQCQVRADSLFHTTAKAYNAVKQAVSEVGIHPKMLSETKMGSAWYVPGGRSYMARLYLDAGADYPWSDTPESGSLPLSPEAVLERAGDADIWLIKYNSPDEMTYEKLADEQMIYSLFRPFRTRHIYGCNTAHNYFYEDLIVHPDWILQDLTHIFHPELLPDYSLRYFLPLKTNSDHE